jgi:pimeloyl-ACP methyl ester carboxylesterase
LRNPLFDGLDDTAAQVADRRRNTAAGLAASLRGTGTGTQEPLWDRLAEIGAPTLVLAGERDTKFRALAARLAAGIPGATFAVVPGAGHTAHLEQPAATATAIVEWRAALSRR